MVDGGLEADGVAGSLVRAYGNDRLIGFLLGYEHAPQSRIITQREPRAGEEWGGRHCKSPWPGSTAPA